MARLQDMTTDFLTYALITNPPSVHGLPNTQNTSFPWTLVVGGQLTTPITRDQIIAELANRIAYDAQNPSLPAESYMGEFICGPTINSNGTDSNVGALSPVAGNQGPTPAANAATLNNGGSAVEPITNTSLIY